MHVECHDGTIIPSRLTRHDAVHFLQENAGSCKSYTVDTAREPSAREGKSFPHSRHVDVGGERALRLDADERVAKRRQPGADADLLPTVGLPPVIACGVPAVGVAASLALATIEDHADVGLLAEFAREVRIEIGLLTGNDEQVLTHGVLLADLPGPVNGPAACARRGRRRAPRARAGAAARARVAASRRRPRRRRHRLAAAGPCRGTPRR